MRHAPVLFLFSLMTVSYLFRPLVYQIVSGRGLQKISGVYVSHAYRVTDQEVRIILYRDIRERNHIKYFDGSKWKRVREQRLNPMFRLFMDCDVEPFLATALLPRSEENLSILVHHDFATERYRLNIEDLLLPSRFANVDGIDPSRKKLGVCLQPVYLHADWTILVQFLEFWIASDVSKIYIYLHSATKQVRTVIDEYQVMLGDVLEIIEWSDLPLPSKNDGDFFTDPNTRLYRVGIYAAINDCIMRARYRVDHLAMLDLDETLVTTTNRTLIDQLNELSSKHPFAASFSLPWIYAEEGARTHEPRYPWQLDLTHLQGIYIPGSDDVLGVYRDLRKLVVRPERVKLLDIHSALLTEEFSDNRNETSQLKACRYEEVRLNASDLAVIHLRRFQPQTIPKKEGVKNISTILSGVAESMQRNYQERLSNHTRFRELNMGSWQFLAENTVRALEECKYFPFNHQMRIGKGTCESITNCLPMISDLHLFQKSNQIWRNIATRSRFYEYVKT